MAKDTRPQVKRPAINLSGPMKPIIEALLLANDGEQLIEASDAIRDVTKFIRDNGGKGHVTIKLVVQGEGKRLRITPEVDSKKPKLKAAPTAVFGDHVGNLGLSDPDQFEMEDVLEEAAKA